jgi:hypothetical protein
VYGAGWNWLPCPLQILVPVINTVSDKYSKESQNPNSIESSAWREETCNSTVTATLNWFREVEGSQWQLAFSIRNNH